MSDLDQDRSAGVPLEDDNDRKCSAGDSPAVPGATRPRFGGVQIRERGRLPHWESDGATYFVTFRLHDTVPESLRREVEERKKLPIKLPGDKRASVKEMEAYLDRSTGACHLKNPAVADVVASTIQNFEGIHYRLLAWVIMPNHVHLVIKLLPDRSLAKTVHSLKSYTSKEANRILGKSGTFWQREYYDRLIRDDAELSRAIQYVRANPEKAGLSDWNWVG